jgi:hypothetical protein
MKLYPDLEPTDSDIANTFIDKHTLKKKFVRPTTYRTLKQAFEDRSDSDELDDVIYDEIVNSGGISDSSLGVEMLINNQETLVSYIMENPDVVTDDFKEKVENDLTDEDLIEKELDNIRDWFYCLDEIIDNVKTFEKYFLEKVKHKLFSSCNQEHYNDLSNAVDRSDEPNKLLIYRSLTLPYNIKDLEDIQENGIGIFWTYDFEKAEAYNSKHDREFIFGAYADVNCIDWEDTLRKSVYSLAEEREICVHDGADLELVSVFLKDYHSNYNTRKEKERLSDLFGVNFTTKNSKELDTYLQDKKEKISTITFDPPIQVTA